MQLASVVIPESGAKRLMPTEVCERIIDCVASRRESNVGYKVTGLFWDFGVHATLQACSLTCRAWRPRSQHHLMRDMAVRASITGFRSFDDMRALLEKIPRLQENMEELTVEGKDLSVPRFHLVPLEIYIALPRISRLVMRGGLVYMPTVFFVCMQRFKDLTQLLLHETTFLSVHDFRRILESLRHLNTLAISFPKWLPHPRSRPPCTHPNRSSRIRLAILEINADAEWITDTRTVNFLDWLSISDSISEIQELRLSCIMLINDDIVAAVSRMLSAAQNSSTLQNVHLLFGPDVDLSPCEC